MFEYRSMSFVIREQNLCDAKTSNELQEIVATFWTFRWIENVLGLLVRASSSAKSIAEACTL